VIEVNLLPTPGKGRKGGRKRKGLALPSFKGMPGDRWVVGAGALALVAVLAIGWLFLGVAGQAEELGVEVEAAQRDSARFADVIRRSETLQARRDTIALRVAALQDIDGTRYVWPHLMDELGRAIPPGIWLLRFEQMSPPPGLTFRVEGRATNYFALTNFMEALEASPFMRGVRLQQSDQVMVDIAGAGSQAVYQFELNMEWLDPPPEVVEREPLFGPSVAIPQAGAPSNPGADGEGR
jgi:Tfp pilus assembly protein PilN